MYKLPTYPGIKRSLVFFIIVLVSMMTIVILSGVYKSDASNENALMMRDMRAWTSKIDEANRNNLILVQHEETFKKLVDKSVIGEENRLSWVEVIQKVANAKRLSSVKYNITSQALLDKKTLDNKYKNIDVYRSTMLLDMNILHEGDLFTMLDALKTEAKGLVTVDKCDIELVNKDIIEGIIDHEAKENMRAYCELSWYTLKKTEKS